MLRRDGSVRDGVQRGVVAFSDDRVDRAQRDPVFGASFRHPRDDGVRDCADIQCVRQGDRGLERPELVDLHGSRGFAEAVVDERGRDEFIPEDVPRARPDHGDARVVPLIPDRRVSDKDPRHVRDFVPLSPWQFSDADPEVFDALLLHCSHSLRLSDSR